ncbi:HPr family phosphocarrier protein [Sediminispirochaeta bajacaliforniensis]|uniref:HPr family phosphocarrier protein n=1 Tax=Sediminispirochaeta bajacaliforniensis TaxID=148 RepID=UPI000362BD2A|nr:HPr family phosphocarrier protein [Sediminispirochaeta bajacaliforniensis]
MVQRSAVIQNKAGIHVRPSGVIMNEVSPYEGKVILEKEDVEVELTSIMALLSLGLVQGDRITIRIEGPDENKTAEKLVELFQHNFDYPGRESG